MTAYRPTVTGRRGGFSLLGLLLAAAWLAAPAAGAPPNIVLLVADDLGWNDVGYHNPEMRTPNLDRLAATGVRLDRHYVTPQCTPTRVCLMTGRHPSRFGEHCTQASNELAYPLGTPTLASLLRAAGYRTAMTGKWHMGSKPEWGPNHFGFDSSHGSLAGAVGMYDHRYQLHSPFAVTWRRDHALIDEVGHATDLVTDEAVRVIRQERSAPLFLYVPFHAVHTPLTEEPKWLDRNRHHKSTDRMLYAAAATHMDHGIGRIVAALDESGLRESTLIVFTSDNGAQVHHRGDTYPPPDPPLRNFSSNAPLRGTKTEVFEGGIRVPALVNWPGGLEPGRSDALIHAVDWAPTLVGLAGARESTPGNLDGLDVWPALRGDGPATRRLAGRRLYWSWAGGQRVAIRQGDWKLLRNGRKESWRLFNVAADPQERRDLATEQPQRVAELKRALAEEQARDR